MNFALRVAGLVHNMSEIWLILQIYSYRTVHLKRLLEQSFRCGTFKLYKRHRLCVMPFQRGKRCFAYARIA